jgi:hypothetical protein
LATRQQLEHIVLASRERRLGRRRELRARAEDDAEHAVEHRVALDRHRTDLDASARPVVKNGVDLILMAAHGAAAHLLDFGRYAVDVLRCYDVGIYVSGAIAERVFGGVVEPEDSPICVADEARDLEALERPLQQLSCRLTRHCELRPPSLLPLHDQGNRLEGSSPLPHFPSPRSFSAGWPRRGRR